MLSDLVSDLVISPVNSFNIPWWISRADEETVLAGVWFVGSLSNRYDKNIYNRLEGDAYRRVAFACNILNMGSESVGDVDPLLPCHYQLRREISVHSMNWQKQPFPSQANQIPTL
jgi:hypothetical protein